MNNAVFQKTMETVRKRRYIKLAKTEERRDYLVSDPKCHTTKFFTESLLAMKMKKRNTYECTCLLGLLILEVSKILIYEFWFDYVKPKCYECYEIVL